MPRGQKYEGPRTYLYKIDVGPRQWTLKTAYLKQASQNAADFTREDQNWSSIGHYPNLRMLIRVGFEKALRQELKHKTDDLMGIQDLYDEILEIAQGMNQALTLLERDFLGGKFADVDSAVVGSDVLEALQEHRKALDGSGPVT